MAKIVSWDQTRGFLNNNPGNIDRIMGKPWNSEIQNPKDPRLTPFQLNELLKGRFCVFPDAVWGIRIIVKNLQAYQNKGINTISTMIDRWAPPIENNTLMYKKRVEKSTKTDMNTPIDMWDYATAYAMTCAIIEVELGGNPYKKTTIEDGLRLAGLIKPATLTGVTASTTKQGTLAAGIGVGTNAAANVIQENISIVSDVIAPMASTSQTMAYVFLSLKILGIAITMVGLGMMVYAYSNRKKRDKRIEEVPEEVTEELEPV
jgi:hypothetical protein